MVQIQIPFATVSSAGADLSDPKNDLVNYFLHIDMQPIVNVVERRIVIVAPMDMEHLCFFLIS